MKNYLIVFMVLFFSVGSFNAQKTMIFTDSYKDYRDGQELFDKLLYSAAQEKFSSVINSIENAKDELRVDAEFYHAVCALELFHLDAEVLLKRFVLDHPDHPKSKKVFFQLGRHNYRVKRFNKVIEFFSLIDPYDLTDKERIEFHFKLAYAYFYKKKQQLSKPHFKEVLSVESDYKIPATYYYSHIAYDEGNLQTALEGFMKIASNKMFKAIVPYYVTQIYHKQKKYDLLIEYAPPYLDSVIEKRKGEFAKLIADAYYYNEQYANSIPYFKEFKKSVKATREDNYQVGYAFYRTQHFEKAVMYLRRVATKKDGMSQTAYYHMADCYLKLDEKDYARNAFQAASKLDFDPEIKQNALFNYAKLAYELSYNPYDEAIDAFHEFIDLYPESSDVDQAYEFLIKVYMTTKNYDDALTSLDKIASKDSRLKVAYQTIVFNRAVELYHNQSFQLARDHFASVKKYPVDKSLNSISVFWKAECSYHLDQFDKAIQYYLEYKLEPGAVLTTQYREADYNIGYCYFKKAKPFKSSNKSSLSEIQRQEYLNRSVTSFRNYLQQADQVSKENLKDAYLRTADCYFILKNDLLAIEYYDNAIATNQGNLSYAYYQKATAQGLVQNYDGKVATLSELTRLYPNSNYQVMSLLNLAQTYNNLGENQKAIDSYKDFISAYPTNSFVSSALVEIGGIYLKDKNYDQAENYFLQVLAQYPDAEAENTLAIELMKEVYAGRDNLPDYYDWLNSKGIEVSQSERDSILWIPVQQARDAGDCELQLLKGAEYLTNIETPRHQISAHYYIGNCLYANGELSEALTHYNFVASKPNNNYYTEVLRYAGNISYDLKDYNQALGHYSTLEKVAVSDEDLKISIIGQLKAFWNLNSYSSAVEYATKTTSMVDVQEHIFVQAMLYKGVSLKELQQFDLALSVLDSTTKLTKSVEAAQAKYYKCEILYTQGNYELCENEIMELVQQKPSYDYWLAKGIILLGDNFVALGDYFNAKHSLQSIVDNYNGDSKAELVKMAQEKIDAIVALENAEEEQFDTKEVEIDFENTDPKDGDLFNEQEVQESENENPTEDSNTDENEE
ncbi:MAG: hypothetical protein CL853_02020 [Crocinitomicaceae bacterium]|nr:hypothetical protein [Crocinitomicaceae bacterium]|tara:strand:+ start:606 stop:3821 length:3216 start_codon:yes stop_codon:yes gene_type:complete